jgi:tRNA modification GTPase
VHDDQTIAAISSAVTPCARIIVRMSGAEARRIAGEVAEALPEPSRARRTMIQVAGMGVPGWVYLFAGPRSYTGEDLVEFHLPGNVLLARLMLEELVSRGARHATAGEFTARAYFSGRMDLAEAEGVAATIAASNEAELRAARQLLGGELSRRVTPIMEALAEMLALVEVGIDFSDEDVTFLATDEIAARIDTIDAALSELVESSARFERLTHEPTFVLTGRPNAGKSTLLNALAGSERAVVSAVAGTTRDVLSARVTLRRGMVIVQDAAGVEAAASDLISRQMQTHVRRAMQEADFVVLVRELGDVREAIELPRAADLVVVTKSDLTAATQGHLPLRGIPKPLQISSVTGEGMDELREWMDAMAFGSVSGGSALALNARHLDAIAAARGALAQARASAHRVELLAADLREALDQLGEILGRVSPDELLGRIFSSFCIGK